MDISVIDFVSPYASIGQHLLRT